MSNFQEWCVNVLPFIEAAASGETIQARPLINADEGWSELDSFPMCFPVTTMDFDNYDYRIKPRTIMIGDIEVPEPMREAPKSGNWYYAPTPNQYMAPIVAHLWVGSQSDLSRIESGLCHDSFCAAVLHHEALIALTAKKVQAMSDKMRDEFEAWWRGRFHQGFGKKENGEYGFPYAENAWQAWQASRTAMVGGGVAMGE